MTTTTVTKSAEIAARAEKVLMANYGRPNLCLVRGRGAQVWDADGKEYTDFLAGIAVCCLGHNHPNVVKAIAEQAEQILHVSNLFLIEPQVRLAETLIANSDMDRAFFCNSGAEANEGAIKLARRYSYNRYGEGRSDIIALNASFHGRTMGAITLTGQPHYHEGFGPMLPGVSYVPLNDLEAMKAAVTDKTCGIFIEPIQGEGGIRPCTQEYLEGVRKLCDEKDIILIFDEVQCGMGRTGHLFAYQHYGVVPNVVTMAKGLGGGVPIGALLAHGDAADTLVAGTHASTFGGNFLATAAANAVLDTILGEDLLARVQETGGYLHGKLEQLTETYPKAIKEVRGVGLMLGIELSVPVAGLVAFLRENGFLTVGAGANVLRFVPPFTIERQQIDALIDVLAKWFADQTSAVTA